MDSLSLKKSHNYLRQFFNQKLAKNLKGLLSSLSPFQATKVEMPKEQDLDLVSASTLVASGLKKTIDLLNGDASGMTSLLANQPEIFRLHRDMLYTSMSRKQRILSGITQQLRKGYCNKEKNGVYL